MEMHNDGSHRFRHLSRRSWPQAAESVSVDPEFQRHSTEMKFLGHSRFVWSDLNSINSRIFKSTSVLKATLVNKQSQRHICQMCNFFQFNNRIHLSAHVVDSCRHCIECFGCLPCLSFHFGQISGLLIQKTFETSNFGMPRRIDLDNVRLVWSRTKIGFGLSILVSGISGGGSSVWKMRGPFWCSTETELEEFEDEMLHHHEVFTEILLITYQFSINLWCTKFPRKFWWPKTCTGGPSIWSVIGNHLAFRSDRDIFDQHFCRLSSFTTRIRIVRPPNFNWTSERPLAEIASNHDNASSLSSYKVMSCLAIISHHSWMPAHTNVFSRTTLAKDVDYFRMLHHTANFVLVKVFRDPTPSCARKVAFLPKTSPPQKETNCFGRALHNAGSFSGGT